ncbi:hypothetical protein C8J57DRAFT_1610264 [Mycena rebaudengoi]|nr:hypothetical protein C8J57DRAFT_1610264 [Mycena rebaudengoi]
MGSSSGSKSRAGPSSAKAGGKRRQGSEEDDSPPPRPTKKRKTGVMPPSSKKNRSDQHHLARDDVAEENKTLQNAMVQHIRFMWGLYDANAVPTPPDDSAIAHFKKNFGTADEIDTFLAGLSYKHKDAKKKIRLFRNDPATLSSRSFITKNIVRMSDIHLDIIYSKIIHSGLVAWNPDVLGSHNSMYNTAHERIAITTFQTVGGAHGYSHVGPNLTHLDDMNLLSKFYRNFVFSYIPKMVKSELKEPGSVQLKNEKKNIYSRRIRLGDSRSVYILQCGYPKVVGKLTDQAECNSDDEVQYKPHTNTIAGYHRKKKKARSGKVTMWIRKNDPPRLDSLAVRGENIVYERLRVDDPNDTTSDISQCLPTPGVPLDWFDPAYFNALPADLRYEYGRKGAIALPLERFLDMEDWKNMEEKKFMKKYGNDVLKLYDLPTAAEMEQIRRNMEDSSDEGNDEDEQDDDEQEDDQQQENNMETDP